MLQRTDNRWLLKLKLSYIAALSVVLVISVTVSKIHLMKAQTSSAPVGFQHNSSQWSTMSIIYLCVSTMIICTFPVMHPGVPQGITHRSSFWEKIKTLDYWAKFGYIALIMFAGLLAPELMVFVSYYEHHLALRDSIIMHKLCPEWTLPRPQHSFFASMGGFTLEDNDDIDRGQKLYERGAIY